ncbi:MAG: cold shock domain-containing protein [Acidobacteria bacterium]|nr:cold shock domain-containing protein [Acidobacteriota bacterium]
MRCQGKISEWNDERGFGFVRPRKGAGRVFVHISAFPTGQQRPSPDEMVSYELGRDDRGRPRAMNVTYIIGRPLARPRQRRSPGLIFATVFAATFLALVVLAVNVGSLRGLNCAGLLWLRPA